jgi:glycosyltransferase involved in cell wall biosynthesis
MEGIHEMTTQQNCSTKPLVSIVLPTYNGSKYLATAIDSCLAQTCPSWELILVDDCSTDSTPQIIADYAARDCRIRPIRHETNKRLPGGLNTGHNAARGEFLTWTSDDNVLRPAFLQEMVGFLQSNPSVGLVYSDQALIDDEGRVIDHIVVLPPEDMPFSNSVRASFLYRRSVWEKVGPYDAEMLYAEDYDYWLRVFAVCRIAALHKELYDYRLHSQSLTARQLTNQHMASEKALTKNLPLLSRADRKALALGWLRVAGHAIRRRAIGKFALCFGKALTLAPLLSIRRFMQVARRDRLADHFHYPST